MTRLFFGIMLGTLLLSSCLRNHFIKNDTQFYRSEQLKDSDTRVDSIVAPYKNQVDAEMNAEVGRNKIALQKEQPEGSLGNWAADMAAERAEFYAKIKVDFAVLNYGGLRIGSIAEGAITKGKIFELLPFDNMLVLVEMPGKDLPLLFNYMLSKGGWPISASVRIKANKDGTFKDINIHGVPIDPNKTYVVATIDYLANGGDNCDFFVGKNRHETGVMLRDAAIAHLQQLTAAGKAIETTKEGRFTIEK